MSDFINSNELSFTEEEAPAETEATETEAKAESSESEPKKPSVPVEELSSDESEEKEEDSKEDKPKEKKDDDKAKDTKKEDNKDAKAEEPKTAKVPKFVSVGDKKLSEADLVDSYQQLNAIQEQWAKGQEQLRQASQILEMAKADPLQFLSSTNQGFDLNEIRERLIKQAIEEEQLTPEQKENRELQERIRQLEEKTQLEKQQQEEQARQVELKKKQEEIGNLLGKAIESSTLASNESLRPLLLKEMAGLLRAARTSGYSPSPETIAQRVESKYYQAFSDIAGSLDAEGIIGLIGEDAIKKIRKYDLNRTKEKQAAKVAPDGKSSKEKQQSKKKGSVFISPWDAML